MPGQPTKNSDLIPSLALVFSACVWGLFWIPLRYLQEAGFTGAWASTSYFVLGAVVLLPMVIGRLPHLRRGGVGLLLIGLVSGSAIALYTMSFLYTTVTKALLIFYLTPIWSTLLGCLLLGEKLNMRRSVALVLGLAGLWVILGGTSTLPIPSNAGDWMALIGGITWAFAAVRLNQSDYHPADYLSVFMLGALVVCSVVLWLSNEISMAPDFGALSLTALFVLCAIAIATLPVNAIILWASTQLSPGRVGILMLFEVCVGIIVAALITDEPYAIRELTGTVLILTAAVVDIAMNSNPPETQTA